MPHYKRELVLKPKGESEKAYQEASVYHSSEWFALQADDVSMDPEALLQARDGELRILSRLQKTIISSVQDTIWLESLKAHEDVIDGKPVVWCGAAVLSRVRLL